MVVSPLVILGVSTLGRRLHAVIPGDVMRTCLLFLNLVLWLLPRKNAMRVHPLALVTCSRCRFSPEMHLLTAPGIPLPLKRTRRFANPVLQGAT